MNFQDDLKKELQRIAIDLGFKISVNQKIDNILLDYLTVRKKLIEVKNQKIYTNPDLTNEILFGQKANEIKLVIETAIRKGNLNYFLSKRTIQTNFHDHLQNEWNIYHFHLSLEKDKKSNFVKQTNTLLFTYIDDSYIVFLGIENHKNGIFGDLKWVEILHEKFPFVIEKFKTKVDIIDVNPKLNAQERQILWNKGFSLGLYKIKDTFYYCPGIGRVMSGHSMEVTETSMEIMRWIKKIEEQIKKNENKIIVTYNLDKENLNYKLGINQKLYIFEENSKEIIIEFPMIFKEI